MSTFIEKNCVFEHEGRAFESGGAWLADCNDGYRRGVVYVAEYERQSSAGFDGCVTDWHGNVIASCHLGRIYRGSFGANMQSVSFKLDGIAYAGRYGCDTGNAVRVRSTKAVRS